MTVLTNKEQTVYDSIKEVIDNEDVYCVHIQGIADDTGMSVASVKGIIGSLVKKYAVGEVEPNEYEHYDPFP